MRGVGIALTLAEDPETIEGALDLIGRGGGWVFDLCILGLVGGVISSTGAKLPTFALALPVPAFASYGDGLPFPILSFRTLALIPPPSFELRRGDLSRVGDFARPPAVAILLRPVEVTEARIDELDCDDLRLGLEIFEESTRAIPGLVEVGVVVDDALGLSLGDEEIGI